MVVGDAGPGEGAADDVVVLGCVEPPHCDMKDSTVRERTERSISEVLFCQIWEQRLMSCRAAAGGCPETAIYLFWDEP